jgi:transposase InsO family protein
MQVPCHPTGNSHPCVVSKALLEWAVEQGVESALIDPGKPWKNGTTESFNGKLRDECLSMGWIKTRSQIPSNRGVKKPGRSSLSEFLCEGSHTIKFIPGKDTYDEIRQSHT